MSKVSLAIIVKDELEQVKKILLNYSEHFSEVHIAVDKDIDSFKALTKEYPTLNVHEYQWCDDFSHKRNFLADKITTPYYFRIDTDDDISNPSLLKSVFEKAYKYDIDVVYMKYKYSRDLDGNSNAEHWRETLIKKSPNIYWKKRIHENIFIEDQSKFNGVRDESIFIIHNITDDHAVKSSERNMKLLLKEFEDDKENTDPRTLAYLGRMFLGYGEYKKSLIFLEMLIKSSGWDDDKYFAWINMAQANIGLGNNEMAIACCNEALSMNTSFPDAYLMLGHINIIKQQFSKAVDWLELGLSKKVPETMYVLDMTMYGHKSVFNLAMAYLGCGKYEEAIKNFNKARAMAPSDKTLEKYQSMFTEAYETNKFIMNFTWLMAYLKENDSSKIPGLVNSIPSNLYKDERIAVLRKQFRPAKKWGEKSIVIFCGNAWEEWASPSVLKGIGGSEEAVIYISKEFVKLGYEVTVYNSCGELEGEYDGVKYVPFYEFSKKDEFNILISWRANMTPDCVAKHKVIWLHDVPDEQLIPANSVDTFDNIIVLSEYHKSLLPSYVPSEKVFVSSNGINTNDFNIANIIRNPKRLIYTSSYDRGLEHLLEMWPDVLKEVPDAELHIFYGWNTYDKMVEVGRRTTEFKDKMIKLMDKPNVFEHGRVGHKALAKEFLKSGIYAYPCHFEEISCISAMKAQAAGCVPVCTDFAALKETVKAGIKVEGRCSNGKEKESFKKEIIKILKDKKSQDLLREEVLKYKDSFGWEKVAETWASNLFSTK